MNKRKVLGQFYTPEKIARYAVSQALLYCKQDAVRAVELSAGEGHLLASLEKMRKNCSLVAVDIDQHNAHLLSQSFPHSEVFCEDGLGPLDQIPPSSFDLGLGNPPFLKFTSLPPFGKKLLSDYLGIDAVYDNDCRAEILFFAQYMRLIKCGGVLSIIMPDTIASGSKLRLFRESVVSKYNLLSISEIDGSAFSNTEAKTHILHVENNVPGSCSSVPINMLNADGEVVESILVDKFDLVNRMDFSYYKSRSFDCSYRLRDHASVSRGNLTHKELREFDIDYIHSTNIKNLDAGDSGSCEKVQEGYVYADHGDVLICRVGSRCVGKVHHYKGDKRLISDCIFKLSFDDENVKLNFLNRYGTHQGEKQLRSIARGVCSRYLTMDDIYSLEF